MRKNTYRVTVYGGKHSGEKESIESDEEIVFNRDEVAHIMKSLRRGNDADKNFAKQIFETLSPSIHCDCCGRRLIKSKSSYNHFHGKILCATCWCIMKDVQTYNEQIERGRLDPMQYLNDIQKSRSKWHDPKTNYLVNDRTIDRCVEKYNELFGK